MITKALLTCVAFVIGASGLFIYFHDTHLVGDQAFDEHLRREVRLGMPLEEVERILGGSGERKGGTGAQTYEWKRPGGTIQVNILWKDRTVIESFSGAATEYWPEPTIMERLKNYLPMRWWR